MKKSRKYNVGVYIHYAPNSWEKEKHFSLKRQLRTLHIYLEKHEDLIMKKEYLDLSDTDDEAVYFEMIEDLERGYIDCVLVREISVIGQTYYHAIDFAQHYCRYYGYRLIAVRNSYDSIKNSSWNDKKLEHLRFKYHDEFLKENQFNRRNSYWERGEYTWGPVPYGYKRINGFLEIDEEVAGIVRTIFKRYANGDSKYAIAEDFRDLNIMSPRCYSYYLTTGEITERYNWNACTVDRILRSRFYIGDVVHRRYKRSAFEDRPSDTLSKNEWLYVEDIHEPIIDGELFKRVRAIIAKRSSKIGYRYRKNGHENFGDEDSCYVGKIRCECGCPMHYRGGPKNFRCYSYESRMKEGCGRGMIHIQKVHVAISDILDVRYGLRDLWITKDIVGKYIDKVTVHEGGILFVELKDDKEIIDYGEKE